MYKMSSSKKGESPSGKMITNSPSAPKFSDNTKIRLNFKCYMNDQRKILGSKFPFLTKTQIQKKVSQSWAKLSKEEQKEYDGTLTRTPCKGTFSEKLRMQKSPAVCTRSRYSMLKSPPALPLRPVTPAALAAYDFDDDDGDVTDEDVSFQSCKKNFASGCKWNFATEEIPKVEKEYKADNNGILKSNKKTKTLRARRRVSFEELDIESCNQDIEKGSRKSILTKKGTPTRNKRKLEFDYEPRKSQRLAGQHFVKGKGLCKEDKPLCMCEVNIDSSDSSYKVCEKQVPPKVSSSVLESRSPFQKKLKGPSKSGLKVVSKKRKKQSRREKSSHDKEVCELRGVGLRSDTKNKNVKKEQFQVQTEVNATGDAKIYKTMIEEGDNAHVLVNEIDLSDDEEKEMHLALLYNSDSQQSNTNKSSVSNPSPKHEQQLASSRKNNWSYVAFSKNSSDDDDQLMLQDATFVNRDNNNPLHVFEETLTHKEEKRIVKKPRGKSRRILTRNKRQDTPAKRKATPKAKCKISKRNNKTTCQVKLFDFQHAAHNSNSCTEKQSQYKVGERKSKLQQLKKKINVGNCESQKDMFGFNDRSDDVVEESDKDESCKIISKNSDDHCWFYSDENSDSKEAFNTTSSNLNTEDSIFMSKLKNTEIVEENCISDIEDDQEIMMSDSSQTIEKIITSMKKIASNGINPGEIFLEEGDTESLVSNSPQVSSTATVEKVIKSMKKIAGRQSKQHEAYQNSPSDSSTTSSNSQIREGFCKDEIEVPNNQVKEASQPFLSKDEHFSLEELFDDVKPSLARRKRVLSSKEKESESNFSQMFETDGSIFM